MPHSFENSIVRPNLETPLEAIANLIQEDLNGVFSRGQMAALSAYHEINLAPVSHKAGSLYRYFVPLKIELTSALAESYRRYFKLAVAQPRQAGRDPDNWAWAHLQPALGVSLDWLREWYILACEGENQWVRPIGSIEFIPGQTASVPIPTTMPPAPPWKSWRAPAWLFAVSLAVVGFNLIKPEHVPPTDTEQRLGAAHTRLLLKGARRLFLWELRAAIERVRDEEIVAAATILTETASGEKPRLINRRGWQDREKLYSAIQKALKRNPTLQGTDLCAELDKGHAPPLHDWTKRGEWPKGFTWKEAWSNPRLRKKIRRVRQEALKRC